MSKHLVVCCDGTWDVPGRSCSGSPCPTNVVRLALSLAETDSDGRRQSVYYHRGVGTGRWDHLRGGAFGVGLFANVKDAYRFLVDNYEPGDRLYFFGFSRGAFTARSVAGMVRNCGILRPENKDRLDDAFKLYRSRKEEPSGMTSTLFRSAFSHEPTIEFIGVWDTVGALGIPPIGPAFLHPLIYWINRHWSFHDQRLSSHVHGAYQALAIDERRKAFRPTLWKREPNPEQRVEQVWFAGSHGNVGGGGANSSLSDLALLWLAQRAQLHGLVFKEDAFMPRREDPAVEIVAGRAVGFTVAPDPITLPANSYTGMYRLMAGPFDRPIGIERDDDPDGGCDQNVAVTAVELRETKPDEYHPKKLIDYLQTPDRPAPAGVPLAYSPLPTPRAHTRTMPF